MTIAALILAGGQGSRLGYVDKAFLRLDGRPLISHLLDRLTPQVKKIAISANGDPSRFAAFHLPVLADAPEHAGKGPLAGVAAGLVWAQKIGADTLLTVPVDTPFAPTDLLAALSPAAAVACYQGRQHHLVAHWPVSLLPALQNFLSAPGAYRVRDALDLCAARQVEFTGPIDPFLNINTQEDLAAAQQVEGKTTFCEQKVAKKLY
jgi:molybdopterin-guanine dinucleotide biosynthesis protein A